MVNEGNHEVNHRDQTAMLTRLEGLGTPGQPWSGNGFSAQDKPSDVTTGLVSLAFIRAAIRRGARLWCATAIAGMLAGFGLYVAFPPAYEASASVLLTLGPYENVNSAPMDNQVIAQSRAVAGLATRMLGLHQDAGSLLADYTVATGSPRVLLVTASAPSSAEAVRRANAVAAAFLRFRAAQLKAEQNIALRSADEQVSRVRQQVRSISEQISELQGRPASAAQQAQLTRLQHKQGQAAATLAVLQQNASASRASSATTLAVRGSEVLDAAAPIRHSRLKRLLPRPAVGLVLGLALGLGFVVIRALSSDKLRRRDDIASALGAPVRLSVGEVRLSRWLRRRRGLAAADRADVRRIVAHLHAAVPASTQSPAALAVVPIGDPRVAALSLVSLALSCAQQGRNAVVADLVPGVPAARLLEAGEPGVRPVRWQDTELVVAVPDPGDVAPAGPLRSTTPGAPEASFASAVAGACGSAGVLLTLAALDPSLGADHLPAWSAAAVVVVTAGKSSWTQIHTASQMMRLAGISPASAILVAADKHDESLGLPSVVGSAATAGLGLEGFSR